MNLWQEFNKVSSGFLMGLGAYTWFGICCPELPILIWVATGFGAYAGVVLMTQKKEPEFELEIPKNQWGR